VTASPGRREEHDDAGMPSWRRSLGEAGPYLGLGMQIALSMALFVALGYAVDRWLGILPWGTITGALVGMATIFYHLLRVLDEMNRISSRKKQQQSSSSDQKGAEPDA